VKQGDAFAREYRVTEKVYRGFIDLFGDRNPLHTNAEFARAKGFPSEVMHGNILGGFLSHFIGECLPTKHVIIHSQEIKYLKPVHLDDALAFTAEVKEVFESVGVVEFGFEFRNAAGVKAAKGKINIGILP